MLNHCIKCVEAELLPPLCLSLPLVLFCHCRTVLAPAELVCSQCHLHMNSYQLPVAIISMRLSEQKENIAFSKIIEIFLPLPPLPLLVYACASV